jgi:hypothetical protein
VKASVAAVAAVVPAAETPVAADLGAIRQKLFATGSVLDADKSLAAYAVIDLWWDSQQRSRTYPGRSGRGFSFCEGRCRSTGRLDPANEGPKIARLCRFRALSWG